MLAIKFLNPVHWPPWRPDDKPRDARFNLTHHAMALVLVLFAVLHLLAAAKHMLIDRDGLLLRM